MNWISYAVLAVIIALCVVVIIRRIRQIKKGKYCNCGCENCPSKTKHLK